MMVAVQEAHLAPGNGHLDVRFVETSKHAGLQIFRHVSGGPHKDYLLESKGGGLAVFDYNGDGWPDIFLVSGATFEESENPRAPRPHRNKLFRNNGDGTFTDVTDAAGLGAWGWGMGAAAADYDNDGCTDLYVTYYGKNVLYHNNCDGTFTDVTDKAGVAAGGWSTGAAWGDYDRDGYLDLYVARYIDFDRREVPAKGATTGCQYKALPVQCGPRGLKFMTHILYHNNGDGSFEEVGLPTGVGYSMDGLARAGMGTDFGDYDQDGWLDILVNNFETEGTALFHSSKGRFFTDFGGGKSAYAILPILTWSLGGSSWTTTTTDY
jgi:hypothetical protein